MTLTGAEGPGSAVAPAAVVLDASAAVALVSDEGADGSWVTAACGALALAGPELMPFEAGNILRRLELRGALTGERAAGAHADLLGLTVETFPYWALADRARELRANVTTYDASSVAVAELVGGAVVTLDERLATAPGPRCPVLTPSTAPAP